MVTEQSDVAECVLVVRLKTTARVIWACACHVTLETKSYVNKDMAGVSHFYKNGSV